MEHYSPAFLQCKAPLVHVVLPRQCRELLPLVCNLLTAAINLYSLHRSVWDDCYLDRLATKYIFQVIDHLVPYTDPHLLTSDSHSVLSPFNSSSDLFPNGILSHRWFDKYVHSQPCVCVQLFMFDSEQNDLSSMVSEIEAFKALCARTRSSPFIILASDGNLHLALSDVPAKTDLPRLAVLHVFCDSPTLKRDCETLVDTLINGIGQCAPSYYARIESRIKQRSKKYYTCPLSASVDTQIQLSPKFLECRNLLKQAIINLFANPENATISTHLFEVAYQDLTMLLSTEFAPLLKNESLSEHDLALYHQVRTLLDVTAFHVVRGYFSLHKPLNALQAHHLHISAIEELAESSSGLRNWKSIQFEWLGQFMSMLPLDLLLPVRELLYTMPNVLWSDLGELMVPRHSSIDSIPVLTGWMFVRASTLLDSVRNDSTSVLDIHSSYLHSYTDPTQLIDKEVDLLKRGLAELGTDDRIPQSVVTYLSWVLATKYQKYSLQGIMSSTHKELVNLFVMCSDFFRRRKASLAYHLFLRKLLEIYGNDNNTTAQLQCAVELSLGSGKGVPMSKSCLFPDIASPMLVDLKDSIQPLLSAKVSLFGPSGSRECVLGNDISIQVSIFSNFSMTRFLSIGGQTGRTTVVIENIELELRGANGEQTLTLEHSDLMPLLPVVTATHQKANLTIPSCEHGRCKVVCTSYTPSKIGRVAVVLARIQVKYKTGNIHFTRVENMDFAPYFAYSALYYTQLNEKLSVETRKLFKGVAYNHIDVGSVSPRIKVAIDPENTSSITIGEALQIPVLISVLHSPVGLTYENIFLSAKLPSNSDQSMRLYWKDLKDDEPLDVMASVGVNGFSRDLIAAVSIPPHTVHEPRNFAFDLVVQYVQQGHTYQQLVHQVTMPIQHSSVCDHD